jgi:hypothetical protein
MMVAGGKMVDVAESTILFFNGSDHKKVRKHCSIHLFRWYIFTRYRSEFLPVFKRENVFLFV